MSSFTLFKNMIHSLLIGGHYGVAAFAADTGSFSRNSSSIVQDVKGPTAVAEPPAVGTGPFGLPLFSDLPGFGWLGSGPSSGRGGNRNPQPANNREVWQPKVGQLFQIILSSSVVLQNGKIKGKWHYLSMDRMC
ncbi:RNA polymerase II subunit A C-terminal domain phosphatase [Venturia nashicola]|nr:RNA polymerase II subunit A C-terminal domain phosphatase [Venturia nashicola]